ncbi:MAG: SDR family oxidoreductase [Candidatus Omnitrophica bacterium]|nr:SDR family oxidoreductase [Candidatus Omnitrophota bacterium]
MRYLVTGGAGFLGSHLCEKLLSQKHQVICVDNLLTGFRENIEHLLSNPGFEFVHADVSKPIEVNGGLDGIYHLASVASPVHYTRYPIQTLKSGALGSHNTLGLAKAKGATYLLASTSEVYGDPLEHPQKESYWGNVNPIGIRGAYDESKRFAEALATAYWRMHKVRIRIARIFNTYGPRMALNDGRVIPTFIGQALRGEGITVHGDGLQTRSLCYVSDLIEGLTRLMESGPPEPVNLGNPQELTIREIAERIIRLSGSASRLTYVDRPADDPEKRRPDISKAKKELGWEPRVSLEEGLTTTISWFKQKLSMAHR